LRKPSNHDVSVFRIEKAFCVLLVVVKDFTTWRRVGLAQWRHEAG
jgi:hypothetical protein